MSKIGDLNINDIPEGWIYDFFCRKYGAKDIQPFDGRSFRIRSFWTEDKTPSLFFFYRDGKYWFKDFSSGIGGGSIHFVKTLEKLDNYRKAVQLIKESYKAYKWEGNSYSESRIVAPVNGIRGGRYVPRLTNWSTEHINFWKQYKIGEETLNKYNVGCISGYTYYPPQGSPLSFMTTLAFIFNNKDGPYQMYIPNRSPKYITLNRNYYPGQDQLDYTKPSLCIMSGLKDIMAFDTYNLDVSLIAGRSESELIDEDTMCELLIKYKRIFAIGDYDETGIRMMESYERLYAIYPVLLPIEKDVADNNRYHELEYMKSKYILAMNNKIKNNENIAVSI
jgi:hypothetical protein